MDSDRIKFYLKRPGDTGPTSIFMKAQINSEPFKYYIGKSIHPELWDVKKGCITTDATTIAEWRKQDPQLKLNLGNIQARISLVTSATMSFVNLKEQADEVFSHDDVKSHLDSRCNKISSQPKTETVLGYIERFVSEIISGKRLTANHSRYTEGTIKNYKGFLVQFSLYQKTKGRNIRFNDIDTAFYREIVSFFHLKEYKTNTIGRHIKSLKVIMEAAKQERIHNNMEFKNFYVQTSKTDSQYLNDEELKSIIELDLSKDHKLEIARDVFIIGCYTALRYSDYSRLSKEHIFEEGGTTIIKVYNKKTDKSTFAPFHPVVKQILEKYNYQLPKTYEQKVNKYIKEICKLAGINHPIEIAESIGGEKRIVTKPKFELIMTHTARRTAATNFYLAGISPILIMKTTGHSTEKDFMKYVRVKDKQAVTILSEHPYFNS